MSKNRVYPTQDTINKQAQAGDPAHSVWVSANAGSGKTHILTERVLRILLTGVRPENILCLTYTKAAAAEMQRRVAERLAGWAVMDQPTLEKTLTALTGKPASSAQMQRARTLFAHALETPGGLKINTIHAFCEAVLHRFSFEADVPVGFSVIEDSEQVEMVTAARDAVLAGGLAGDPKVSAAVATLFSLMSDHAIQNAVSKALAQHRILRDILAEMDQAKQNLRQMLGLEQGLDRASPDRASLDRLIVDGGQFTRSERASVLALTPPLPDKNRFEDRLARLDWDTRTAEQMFATFLTNKGTVNKRGFPKSDIKKADPLLADCMLAEAERLEALYAHQKRIDLYARSTALLDVLGAVQAHYERAKANQNKLDFDDLIARLVGLLANSAARDWVLYKLDADITHLLVDESQDTNPDQWRVVEALVDDFFDGDSAIERPRTIFAVGDEKQSIYSFQGADPALFAQTGTRLKQRARLADKPWADLRFRASFRTLENILNAVDEVCKPAPIQAALLAGDAGITHESARADKGGTVTVWPVLQTESMPEADLDWPVQVASDQRSAPRQLAELIAQQIADWLQQKRPLGARNRAIEASDILILVQSRGAAFNHIIRALKQQNIATPGADKLPVTEHIVVTDLLALADILLNPSDDLTLAALLRSPLFDIGEMQLAELNIGRPRQTRLWEALGQKAKQADQADWAEQAYAQLSRWRDQLDFERPYAFFAQVLFAERGLEKFHARLGDEIYDVISAFLDLALDHEQKPQPGLLGFVAAMRARDIRIKRELSEAGSGVRVMTVHGAKGLEAPIVILADAATYYNPPEAVYMRGGDSPVLVHAGAKTAHVAETEDALRAPHEARLKQEYWRKLYVAMTRAEDELIVAGHLGARGKVEGTWFEAISDALTAFSDPVELPGHPEGTAMRYPQAFVAPTLDAAASLSILNAAHTTEPLVLPAIAQPKLVETISPSLALEKDVEFAPELVGAAQLAHGGGLTQQQANFISDASVTDHSDAESARKYGIALHALLQHLEKVPDSEQRQVGLEALNSLLPGAKSTHEEVIDKALAILHGAYASVLFGPSSRPELALVAAGTKNGNPVKIVGRVDRFIVEKDHVLLVDFKSDARPPTSVKEVPRPYLVQLGLYLRVGKKLFPNHDIRAAAFWTRSDLLMDLPQKLLLDATAHFNII